MRTCVHLLYQYHAPPRGRIMCRFARMAPYQPLQRRSRRAGISAVVSAAGESRRAGTRGGSPAGGEAIGQTKRDPTRIAWDQSGLGRIFNPAIRPVGRIKNPADREMSTCGPLRASSGRSLCALCRLFGNLVQDGTPVTPLVELGGVIAACIYGRIPGNSHRCGVLGANIYGRIRGNPHRGEHRRAMLNDGTPTCSGGPIRSVDAQPTTARHNVGQSPKAA